MNNNEPRYVTTQVDYDAHDHCDICLLITDDLYYTDAGILYCNECVSGAREARAKKLINTPCPEFKRHDHTQCHY